MWRAAAIGVLLATACAAPPTSTPDDVGPPPPDAWRRDPCDRDGDGVLNGDCLGWDCDDGDASIWGGPHGGATEVCDGVDQDCDHRVDEGLVPSTYYVDVDGDGYAGGEGHSTTCPPAGSTSTPNDCDENDARVHPGAHDGAPDGCNGLDDDCNGSIDDDCVCTAPTERCGALDPDDPSGATLLERGACQSGVQACMGTRWGACVGAVFPIAEICTDLLDPGAGVDEDCDGRIDETTPPRNRCGCPSFGGGWDPIAIGVTRGTPTNALGLVLTLVAAAPASTAAPASADVAITCGSTTADEGTVHVDTATPADTALYAPTCSVGIRLVEADADHAVLEFAFSLCG